MAMWDKQLAQLGAESGWLIHLIKHYVDEITAVVETLNPGTGSNPEVEEYQEGVHHHPV